MKIVAFEDEEFEWLIDFLSSFLEDVSHDTDARSTRIATNIIFKLKI